MSGDGTLEVALAGCGIMGRRRAAALAPDRLTACCDVNAEAANELAGETGATACGSIEELLETRPDAVIVATSHDALAELASKALAAGANVLVEKPGARSSEELGAVTVVATSSGRMLHVGFNHRFHPGIARAAAEARSGEHGEILFVRGRYGHGGRLGYEDEWRAQPELSGGGELMDQGMHLLDLSHWLLGPLPLHSALLRTNFWPVTVEDNAVLVLGEAGEAHAPWSTFHVSWTEWKNDFALEIYCRRAKLQVTGLWGSYGPQVLRIYRMGPELGPPDIEVLEYSDEDQSWAPEWQHFRSAVLSGQPTDVGSALYALGTIEEAYRLTGFGTTAAAR
jgi:predicted dehydrogenase